MLVSFTTRFGHVIMQGEPALALLRLGGHSGAVPSAVLEAELPAFLARLRSGLELHGHDFSPAPEPSPEAQGDAPEPDDSRELSIRLRQRAVPLIEMIELAIQQHSDLIWERV